MLRTLPSRVGERQAGGHPSRWLALLVVGLAAALLAPSASVAQGGDLRAERERVRAERAGVASEVDALEADQAEVESALAALDENLRGHQAAYADAERALAQAEAQLEAAIAAEAAKRAEIADLRGKIAELAVAAYVHPPSQDVLASFEAESAVAAARKRTLLDLRAGRDLDLLDALRGAEADLEAIRVDAEEAGRAAEEHRATVGSRLADVTTARDQQATFVSQVQQRLDAKLGEAAALAATDASLSQQIAAQEAELAARLKREADARAAADRASSAGRSSSGASSSSGGGSTSRPPVGNVAVTNVRGITVATSVAAQTEQMLAAAAAAGFTFGGTGYRDPSAQIALRRQNCGTSDYAVYQAPAESCSPATARPGSSKHEQGLAIDFTVGGSTLRYGTPAFQWLSANAGSYGYINSVPGEPWHWSVGGG